MIAPAQSGTLGDERRLETDVDPILTVAIPSYNSEQYLGKSVDSILEASVKGVEILIVNDGSVDGTAAIADAYAAAHPGTVRVIHKENGGHGSAINAGLAAARGTYFKVLDSDDWLDQGALQRVLTLLRDQHAGGELDLLITNFVYEKQGKRLKRAVHYRRALPRGQVFTWKDVGRFLPWQYMLMHSMTYRTELLRESSLHVPENSFYVDNYFAFVPLPAVERLQYLDVDLYRYFIGREDQSVNEKVMIGRIDQQINVNLLMVEALSDALQKGEVKPALARYMTRYATLVSAVSSVLLLRSGTEENKQKRRYLWQRMNRIDPRLARRIRRGAVGNIVSREAKWADAVSRASYHLTRLIVGYN